jgi:hypothetical protein
MVIEGSGSIHLTNGSGSGSRRPNVRKKDIRFCRRIGERGLERRPILVGMKNEVLKAELLDAASSLKDTDYHTVSIGPIRQGVRDRQKKS